MKYLVTILIIIVLAAGGTYFFFLNKPEGKVNFVSVNSNFSLSSAAGLISFVSNRDGNDEIYLTDSSGLFFNRITETAEREYGPKLSLSSNQIAFFSQSSDYTGIYLFSLSTEEKRLLNITRGFPRSLKISPDDRRLAFLEDFSSKKATGDLYLVDLQTGKVERVASEVQDYNWSSDSNNIIYAIKDPLASITDTKLLFRTIDEKGTLLDEIELFKGGVAPIYLMTSKKIIFLDVKGEFLQLISMTLRGENQKELFTIRIRPQENSSYFMDVNSANNEVLLNIYSDQLLIESLIVSLEEQSVKKLELEANNLEWGSGEAIVYTTEDQSNNSQIWFREGPNSESYQITKEMNNWF